MNQRLPVRGIVVTGVCCAVLTVSGCEKGPDFTDMTKTQKFAYGLGYAAATVATREKSRLDFCDEDSKHQILEEDVRRETVSYFDAGCEQGKEDRENETCGGPEEVRSFCMYDVPRRRGGAAPQ